MLPASCHGLCRLYVPALHQLRVCLQQRQRQRLRLAHSSWVLLLPPPCPSPSQSPQAVPLILPPLVAACCSRPAYSLGEKLFLLYLNFPRSHLALSLTLGCSRSLARSHFLLLLSAFSSFYFLLIIFNFFRVSILALSRVFSFIFFLFFSSFSFHFAAAAAAAAAVFLGAAGTCCCLLCACSSAGRRRPFWRLVRTRPDPRPGLARSGQGTARRGWWSSYIYTCGALIFFSFSFSRFFSLSLSLSRLCLFFTFVALRCPARFYELCFVLRGFLLLFRVFFAIEFFVAFVLLLRCLRLVNFLARLWTWPAGARQVLGQVRVSLGNCVIFSSPLL